MYLSTRLRLGSEGQRRRKRTDKEPESAYPSKRIRVVPEDDVDFFSRLSDDIIILVLSRLETVKQQVATSVLARRWRHLWKKSTCANLTFTSGSRVNKRFSRGPDDTGVFVSKVNKIIGSLGRDDCNTMTIDHLNIVFRMIEDNDKIYQSDIDGWLSFALQKKVQHLNLDCGSTRTANCYSLTDSQAFCSSTSSSIGMLRSLSLFCVEVTGELLEYILTVTPHLEELSVKSGGPSLVKFTVAGPSLKLKHLQLLDCLEVERLVISNVNLESLNYDGNPESLIIEETPYLLKVCTSIFIDFDRMKEFSQMLSKLPKLETLALSTLSVNKSFHQFPKLRNLKRLELVPGHRASCSTLCASLLDASPVLRELKIELFFLKDSRKEERVSALSNPHKSLKVIEVNGFTGCEHDMGVVDYLIENTVLIEKMIVVTHISSELKDPEKHEAVRALAKAHLEKRLSGGNTILIT